MKFNFNKELFKKANIMFANGWSCSKVAEKLQIDEIDAEIYQAKRLMDMGLCAPEVRDFTGVEVSFKLSSKEQSQNNPEEYEYWYTIQYSDGSKVYEEDWFVTQ